MLLARDRLGVKPLHYIFDNKRLVFASDKKAILATKMKDFSINWQNFIPILNMEQQQPQIIFKKIYSQ